MADTAQNIVHESEAQRQFVRIPLPAKAEINGKEYAVKDLSSGGIGLKDVTEIFDRGQTVRMTLILPFNDFSLDAHLEAQVQSVDSGARLVGARFVNMTASQISILNHVIRAYMTGDIVSSGDILSVAGRSDFVRVRNQGGAGTKMKKNFIPLLLIALAGLCAFYVIFKNVYEGVYIVSSSQAVVVSDSISLKAPVSGTYSSLLATDTFNVQPQEKLAEIIPNREDGRQVLMPDGTLVSTPPTDGVSISSPCDCFIKPLVVEQSTYVEAGTPLYQLTPVDAAPQVVAYVEPSEAQRLQINDNAVLKIAGTTIEATGRVTDIQWQNEIFLQKDGNPVVATKVIISPNQKLPPALTNRPVRVDFQTF